MDRTLRRSRLAAFGLICFLLPAGTFLAGQANISSVEGIVEDSTGARVPEANVKLVNGVTGAENRSTTNQDGLFALPGIFPGPYTLEIARYGFATVHISGLTLTSGETRNLLIRLKIGSVTESVQIEASAITVNNVDASVTTIVDREFVANFPLNGRSFEDLITMAPGVLTESPQAIDGRNSQRGGVSVNGQRTDMNRFVVDGVSANFGTPDLSSPRKFPGAGNSPALTAMGTTLSLSSVDAIQEFRIHGSSYSAEFGGVPGGQVLLTTRSGTNAIHGTLFDYARDSSADSVDWFSRFNEFGITDGGGIFNHGYFSGLSYQQNDFGGAFSAPVSFSHVGRNQTFAFISVEQTHVSQPTAFSIQFFPAYEVFQHASAAMLPILHDFGEYRYIFPGYPVLYPELLADSLPGKESTATARVDHNFSPALSGFFRISSSPSNGQHRDFIALTTDHVDNQAVTLGTTLDLSSIRNNEFRLGYGRSFSHSNTALGFFGGQPYTDLPADLGAPFFARIRGQAYIRIPGAGDTAIGTDDASGFVHQWNLRDTLSFQSVHHFLRVGFDYRHFVSAVDPAPVSVQADFLSAGSLLSNRASDIAITRSEPAQPVFNEFSAFAQDDWKLAKTLTISPGLRWDVNPPPRGANGGDAYTLLGNVSAPGSLQLASRGTPLWRTGWLNFAPRVGIAWTANNRNEKDLVVRAGAGIFFGTNNAAGVEAFNALGFSATSFLENVPVPVASSQFDFSTAPSPPYTRAVVFAFPRHFQLPYSLQWNVAVEKALGRGQSLSASWIGASGRRLLEERRINLGAANPNFGEVSWFPGGYTSSYESLQLKFQRSFSSSLQALASYAWSHNLDYGSTDPAFPLVRGNSDLDVRHSVQAALSWSERSRDGGWLRRELFGKWGAEGRLMARTAFPVNLLGNLFSDPATGDRYYSGVDRVPGRPLYLFGAEFPDRRTFNGGPKATNPAFVLPEGSNPGNAPRNLVRGFGDFQINTAIRRELHLFGPLNLQLRAEAFNIFNHPDLGYVDPHLTNLLFGQATLLLNQSFGSPGSLFEPGGPRSLQFSARVRF